VLDAGNGGLVMDNLPEWGSIAEELDRYYVGGGCHSGPRVESVWKVLGKEVRIRVRRKKYGNMGWQFYTNSNARLGSATSDIDGWFPEFLDVRCPDADEDYIGLLRTAIEPITDCAVSVSNNRFMPRINKRPIQ